MKLLFFLQMRAKEVVNSGKYDVVTLDWFKRVTDRSRWASLDDFLPWELLCCRNTTRSRVELNYDKHYDHFRVDADEESLERSFAMIVKSVIFTIYIYGNQKISIIRYY